MVGVVLYPAVVFCYFCLVSWGSQRDQLVLDSRASLNVFCLFAVVQPLCLALGGAGGMLAFCTAALLSYALLPRAGRGGKVRRARPQDRKAKSA